MTFTAASDVAKAVARAIDSDEPWSFEGAIIGEKLVAMAQDSRV